MFCVVKEKRDKLNCVCVCQESDDSDDLKEEYFEYLSKEWIEEILKSATLSTVKVTLKGVTLTLNLNLAIAAFIKLQNIHSSLQSWTHSLANAYSLTQTTNTPPKHIPQDQPEPAIESSFADRNNVKKSSSEQLFNDHSKQLFNVLAEEDDEAEPVVRIPKLSKAKNKPSFLSKLNSFHQKLFSKGTSKNEPSNKSFLYNRSREQKGHRIDLKDNSTVENKPSEQKEIYFAKEEPTQSIAENDMESFQLGNLESEISSDYATPSNNHLSSAQIAPSGPSPPPRINFPSSESHPVPIPPPPHPPQAFRSLFGTKSPPSSAPSAPYASLSARFERCSNPLIFESNEMRYSDIERELSRRKQRVEEEDSGGWGEVQESGYYINESKASIEPDYTSIEQMGIPSTSPESDDDLTTSQDDLSSVNMQAFCPQTVYEKETFQLTLGMYKLINEVVFENEMKRSGLESKGKVQQTLYIPLNDVVSIELSSSSAAVIGHDSWTQQITWMGNDLKIPFAVQCKVSGTFAFNFSIKMYGVEVGTINFSLDIRPEAQVRQSDQRKPIRGRIESD